MLACEIWARVVRVNLLLQTIIVVRHIRLVSDVAIRTQSRLGLSSLCLLASLVRLLLFLHLLIADSSQTTRDLLHLIAIQVLNDLLPDRQLVGIDLEDVVTQQFLADNVEELHIHFVLAIATKI